MSKENDWKLFSKKYFEWKNRYLEQFITEALEKGVLEELCVHLHEVAK